MKTAKNLSIRAKRFITNEDAAEVTELAIALALIVAGCVALAIAIGIKNTNNYSKMNSVLP